MRESVGACHLWRELQVQGAEHRLLWAQLLLQPQVRELAGPASPRCSIYALTRSVSSTCLAMRPTTSAAASTIPIEDPAAFRAARPPRLLLRHPTIAGGTAASIGSIRPASLASALAAVAASAVAVQVDPTTATLVSIVREWLTVQSIRAVSPAGRAPSEVDCTPASTSLPARCV